MATQESSIRFYFSRPEFSVNAFVGCLVQPKRPIDPPVPISPPSSGDEKEEGEAKKQKLQPPLTWEEKLQRKQDNELLLQCVIENKKINMSDRICWGSVASRYNSLTKGPQLDEVSLRIRHHNNQQARKSEWCRLLVSSLPPLPPPPPTSSTLPGATHPQARSFSPSNKRIKTEEEMSIKNRRDAENELLFRCVEQFKTMNKTNRTKWVEVAKLFNTQTTGPKRTGVELENRFNNTKHIRTRHPVPITDPAIVELHEEEEEEKMD